MAFTAGKLQDFLQLCQGTKHSPRVVQSYRYVADLPHLHPALLAEILAGDAVSDHGC